MESFGKVEEYQLPKTIGKYEVLSEIGRGGFGIVLKGRQGALNKLVAIKVLHGTLVVDGNVRARFEQEAKAGATLSHPNLVPVIDYGFTERGEPYLVMEYVEGIDLEQYMVEKKPKLAELLSILSQIAKSLRYLHDGGIVHRDLKTSNVLVQDVGGEKFARLLDLGIAKVFTGDEEKKNTNLTSTGMILGSPMFMSPEQCQGLKTDGRSDIYSFGCVIYQCMSGHHPFTGDNPMQVLLKHLQEQPKPLEYKTTQEYELAQVCAKCMEKDPANRYQGMKEIVDDLQKISMMKPNERVRSTASRSYTAPETTERNTKPLVMLAVAAAILIPLAVILVMTLQKPKVAVQPVSAPPVVNAQAQSPSQPQTPDNEAELLRKQLAEEKAARAKEKEDAEKAAIARRNKEASQDNARDLPGFVPPPSATATTATRPGYVQPGTTVVPVFVGGAPGIPQLPFSRKFSDLSPAEQARVMAEVPKVGALGQANNETFNVVTKQLNRLDSRYVDSAGAAANLRQSNAAMLKQMNSTPAQPARGY